MASFGMDGLGPNVVTVVAANTKAVSKFTLAEAGTINALVIAFMNGGGHFNGVIYADSGGAPGALISVSDTTTGSFTGIAIVTWSSPPTLAAGNYWIGLISDGGIQMHVPTVTGNLVSNANTYGSGASNPFGASPTVQNFELSIYAMFTPTTAGSTLGELSGGNGLHSGGESSNMVALVGFFGPGTPGQTLLVDKMIAYVSPVAGGGYGNSGPVHAKAAIYGGPGTPGALLATSTNVVTPFVGGGDGPWRLEFDFSPPVSVVYDGSEAVYFGLLTDNGGTLNQYNWWSDNSLSANYWHTAQAYGSGFPNPWPGGGAVSGVKTPSWWLHGTVVTPGGAARPSIFVQSARELILPPKALVAASPLAWLIKRRNELRRRRRD